MEASFQQICQSCAPSGGAALIMKARGTMLPVPRANTCNGRVLRPDARAATTILRGADTGRVCVNNFSLRLCEFVWGVNVLTKVMRYCVATRGNSDCRPVVSRFIQDKERHRSGGSAPGFGLHDRYLEGTE